MTDDEIARDRAVIEAATKWPWRLGVHAGEDPGSVYRDLEGTTRLVAGGNAPIDAHFIAAAHSRWPAALDEVERLHAELSQLRRERDEARQEAEEYSDQLNEARDKAMAEWRREWRESFERTTAERIASWCDSMDWDHTGDLIREGVWKERP